MFSIKLKKLCCNFAKKWVFFEKSKMTAKMADIIVMGNDCNSSYLELDCCYEK